MFDWEERRVDEDEVAGRREESGGGLLRAVAVIMSVSWMEVVQRGVLQGRVAAHRRLDSVLVGGRDDTLMMGGKSYDNAANST